MHWDPPREAFTIPFVDISIYWYSLFFAFGFLVGYFVVRTFIQRRLQDKKLGASLADTLLFYVFVGMLVGARLGHVLFYDFDYFASHPEEIFLLRQGGLASHGGAIGILIAFALFYRRNRKKSPISWITYLDYLAVGTAFCGGCIRVGNFFNQEIQGTPTDLPWGVVFGHGADGVTVACHPVQLYEALFYFFIFALLFCIMRKYERTMRAGICFGLFMVLVFTFRFFIEWIKIPQESEPTGVLQMGQLLSLPFIALGIYFLFFSKE